MPPALNLRAFNLDGFKDTIADWDHVLSVARDKTRYDIEQVILERKLPSSLVVQLCRDGRIIPEKGIAVLKHQFRSSNSEAEQADILSDFLELIVFKEQPTKNSLPLIGRPWFGPPSCDEDHLSSILKDKEELALDVVIALLEDL